MRKTKKAFVVRDYYNEIIAHIDPTPHYERFRELSDTPDNVNLESIASIMSGHAAINKYSVEDVDDSVEFDEEY